MQAPGSRSLAVLGAVVVVLAASCGAPATTARFQLPTGAVSGLARDRDSGDPIQMTTVTLTRAGAAPLVVTTSELGLYSLPQVPPGTYQLDAAFAGQTLKIRNVAIQRGELTVVDLDFHLATPTPIVVDYGNVHDGEIAHMRPHDVGPTVARLEGWIADSATRYRVAGAVVTVVPDGAAATSAVQTITDDQGRFQFDGLAPGVYDVSAYYAIGNRGQIEQQRNDISIGAGEAALVPLWLELEE